jgi:hypothetical protein
MKRLCYLLATVAALSLLPARANAQEQRAFPSWSPEGRDSVRQKVGYRHWEGAAVGAGAGAVVGLVLGFAVRYSCSDCSSDPSLAATSLATAGLVGAFGFLVGLASPKYRWIADTVTHAP